MDGRRLWYRSAGAGAPSVVFLPGAGSVGLDYALVGDTVSSVATTVLYDRGGTGWSDAVDLPRPVDAVAEELRTLVDALKVARPLVLVGHGLGALYARRYAQHHPGDVAALVLLDPVHEEYNDYMPPRVVTRRSSRDLVNEELPANVVELAHDFYRMAFGDSMERWPPLLRDALLEAHASLDWLRIALFEASNLPQLLRQARRASVPLPDVPTTILSSAAIDGFTRARRVGESDALLEAEIDAKHQLYFDLAARLSRADVRRVDSGNTTMPFLVPDAVAAAITEAIEAAREDAPLEPPSR